jgi:hypothetical protein
MKVMEMIDGAVTSISNHKETILKVAIPVVGIAALNVGMKAGFKMGVIGGEMRLSDYVANGDFEAQVKLLDEYYQHLTTKISTK